MPSSNFSLHPKPLKPSNNNNNNNSTNQACAACKYQRRKCASDCILAPYFPHDRHNQFLNAHKLYGVSNITKIIIHPKSCSERCSYAYNHVRVRC
ncbi:unnamed protein product [Cochlearia groenlandica]